MPDKCVEPHFTASFTEQGSPRRELEGRASRRVKPERSVGAGAGRQAQRRPSAAAHVVLVTASCARKPAAAIMPRRACASSFSYTSEGETGQAEARPGEGEARVGRGLRGKRCGGKGRGFKRGCKRARGLKQTCIRRNSAGSVGAKPAGAKPIWPGLYPGRSQLVGR